MESLELLQVPVSLPAARRARDLLRQGRALIEALGRGADAGLDEALGTMQRAGSAVETLLAINDELQRLDSRAGPRWWRWLAASMPGRRAEAEPAGAQVMPLVGHGLHLQAGLLRDAALLRTQRQQLSERLGPLGTDAEAAALLCDRSWWPACCAAGLERKDLARLTRQARSLDGLVSAMEISLAQLELAEAGAQAAADRFAEIRSVLMATWKQPAVPGAMARAPCVR
jgi:hypothetical protein